MPAWNHRPFSGKKSGGSWAATVSKNVSKGAVKVLAFLSQKRR
jgi:hypothetical protein